MEEELWRRELEESRIRGFPADPRGKEPESIDPEEIEMDLIPEGYDFNKRKLEDPIPPTNFLPPETNRRILKSFYILLKTLYGLSEDIKISFAMTNLLLLGSNFMKHLITELFKISGESFLFSQVGMETLINLYVSDEDYEDFVLRKKTREDLVQSQSKITGLIKGLSPEDNLSKLYQFLKINETTLGLIDEFNKIFSLRGSTFSENFNSFITNGVIKFRKGLGLYSLLFTHDFKSNRSAPEGEPIYKLLNELEEPNNMELLRQIMNDTRTKELMESLFNVMTLFSLLNPEVRMEIVNSSPNTKSAAEMREQRGTKLPTFTYMDRVPGFFQINTDLFRYIVSQVPKHKLKEFKDNLYNSLNEEKSKEEFNSIIIDFTGYDINYHNEVFAEIIKNKFSKAKKKPKAKKITKKSGARKKKISGKKKSGKKKKRSSKKKTKRSSKKKTKRKSRKIEVGDIIIKYN